MSSFTLIKTNFNHHVSMDLYHEFEKCIIKNTEWSTKNSLNSLQAKSIRYLLSVIPPFQIPFTSKKNYFIVGFQKEKFFPYFYIKSNKKVLWMYDAWEPLFPKIIKTINGFKITTLFTGSKQSADYFNSLSINNFSAHWIPEAVEIENYQTLNYHEKTTDVLQLGRKWNAYHELIKDLENNQGISYKYEKEAGQLIFKNRADFIKGLAEAKISICVPTIDTHPERAGYISTMTNRYFQSMASKCLILGKAPYDMQFLFDYNPIIEIDLKDPIGQIMDIIKHFDDYIPLIEKNYAIVKAQHTWKNRLGQIQEILSNDQ